MRIENKILHRDCCSRGIAIVGGRSKGKEVPEEEEAMVGWQW